MNNNTTALADFINHKNNIQALLNQLSSLADDHFGYSPDEIDWSHTGTLASIRQDLTQLAQKAGIDTQEIEDSE